MTTEHTGLIWQKDTQLRDDHRVTELFRLEKNFKMMVTEKWLQKLVDEWKAEAQFSVSSDGKAGRTQLW